MGTVQRRQPTAVRTYRAHYLGIGCLSLHVGSSIRFERFRRFWARGGQPAAYAYSDAMKVSNLTWDEGALDKFIAEAYVVTSDS